MRMVIAALSAASALFFGEACLAATIEPVQGELSINRGQGFEKVNARIDANVGDAVMVGPDGSATVSYPDGCKVNVAPGAVMTVAPLSPCASGSYAADQNPPIIVASPPSNVTPPSFSVDPWLIGAAGASVAGFIAYEISQSKPTPQPASP